MTAGMEGVGAAARWGCELCGEMQPGEWAPIKVCYQEESGLVSVYDACEVCASEARRDEAGELRLDLNPNWKE